VLSPKVLDRIEDDMTIWEQEPLEPGADGELMAYQHRGFWQPMDTLRDKQHLETLWAERRAPWRVWNDGRSRFLVGQARFPDRPYRLQGRWLTLWLRAMGAVVKGLRSARHRSQPVRGSRTSRAASNPNSATFATWISAPASPRSRPTS
jgi:hypothetical protein